MHLWGSLSQVGDISFCKSLARTTAVYAQTSAVIPAVITQSPLLIQARPLDTGPHIPHVIM